MMPRFAHGMLLFIGEHFFFRFNVSKYGYDSAKWGLVAMIFCWFNYFCGCRSLTNVTETALNMIALNLFHQRKWTLHCTIALRFNGSSQFGENHFKYNFLC